MSNKQRRYTMLSAKLDVFAPEMVSRAFLLHLYSKRFTREEQLEFLNELKERWEEIGSCLLLAHAELELDITNETGDV